MTQPLTKTTMKVECVLAKILITCIIIIIIIIIIVIIIIIIVIIVIAIIAIIVIIVIIIIIVIIVIAILVIIIIVTIAIAIIIIIILRLAFIVLWLEVINGILSECLCLSQRILACPFFIDSKNRDRDRAPTLNPEKVGSCENYCLTYSSSLMITFIVNRAGFEPAKSTPLV